MEVFTCLCCVCTVLLCTALAAQSVTLVGKVGMKGVKGTITFVQNGGDTTVTAALQGLQNENAWTVREIRTVYDVADNVKCSDPQLGNQVGSFTGNIPSQGSTSVSIPTSALSDLRTFTGRTILLVDKVTSVRICATLEEDAPYNTAMAVLPSTISGHVVLRQLASSSVSHTSSLVDLFFVTPSPSETNATLKVYNGVVTESADVSQRCRSVGSSTITLGTVGIGVTKGGARTGLIFSNVPLSGANNVINKTLVVEASDGTVLACSTIREVRTREAITQISRDGVKGQFRFMQASPFDVTNVMVEVSGLNNKASGYHVHSWPVPQKLVKDEPVCDASYVSGHFNPYAVNVNGSPPAGTGTDDEYEVGDLSGKYGLLDSLDSINETYMDWNLPLFGVNSIIGRSIVIHKLEQGARWVCANIESMEPIKIASITFTYPVIGYMIFKQPKNAWYNAETQVYAELNYGDGTSAATFSHNWHVHITKVGNDMDAASSRCMSVGGHYNPYGVDLDGNYTTECGPNNPLRCEVGDLSGKHGKISVRTGPGGMQRAFFTDVDLPLSGPLSIVGKSVVIHGADSGANRLACGDILHVPERMVKVDKWYKNSASSVSGMVTMSENTHGALSGITKTMFDLQNLAAEANGLHVHTYPVNETDPGASPCGPASVGGHFIPYDWKLDDSPANGTGTDDQYEVGDLSGRYGSPLLDQTLYSGMYDDTNLPLRGPLSVVGRSIVIHKSDQAASRWVCGNIVEAPSTTGKLYQAKAVFTEGDIQGEILLKQYYYSDGGSSDTEVTVDLHHTAGGAVTTGHNWHVHEKQVNGDATSGCMTPGGHYNPFHSNLTSRYAECSFTNPLRCELGDQAGKLGQYDVGRGRRFYTDVYLPLMGRYGVSGRSFVIHGPNKGAERVACANIMPIGMPAVQLSFPLTQNFDKNDMKTVLATAMKTDSWNIMVEQGQSSTTNSDCMTAMVTMLGSDAENLKTTLQRLVSNKDSQLGKYSVCSSASRLISSSLFMLMVSVIALRKLLS